MKESQLRQIIREELMKLDEGSYEDKQMGYAIEGHDWTFKVDVQFRGVTSNSKWLSINEKQFNAIRNILKKGS